MARNNCYYHFSELPSKVFCLCAFFKKYDWWACGMAQHIKFPAANPEDLSSIPRTRMVERENGVWELSPNFHMYSLSLWHTK